MKTSIELRQQKAKLIHDARAIYNRAEATGEDMGAEDKGQYEGIMSKVDELDARITQLEKLESAESDLEDVPEENGKRSRFLATPETRDVPRHATAEYRKKFQSFLKTGHETRDLSVGSQGTDYLAPVEFSKQFIIALNNLVFIRQLANVETLGAAVSLRVRKLGTDVSDANWTAEVPSPFTADTAMAISHIDLTPSLLSKMVLASHQIIKQTPDIEKLVNDRLAYKFAVAQESAYLTGDGSGKPLGVFTASSSGVPTSQDVALGAAVTANGIYDTIYSLAQQYTNSKSACWVMHRSITKSIRELKDSQGRYMWEPSVQAGQPEMLAGHPLYYSEYAPSATTNGSYVWVFGDFQFYTITELADLEIQRLVERYADVSEIGFLARYYGAGGPVLANAFARGKISA